MERTAADRVKDPVIGRLLDGRYLVGERIARGGMATVYAATDTRLDRTVAVKVMHPGLGDDDSFSRRFRREAQAAARLAHQNVVAVFDQGDDEGVLFLVMELVSGITLRDLIHAEAPIPPIKALAVIEPVLAALASAHHGGMIHRDVKPENVLLSDDGRVKVADFGLARAVNAETQHTGTGVLIGTVSYLSPELVVAGEADARADVYAAGVLIYEMLTGQKPHQAESPIQVAYKHVHEDIPPPSRLVPSLPPYVDALVARATARDTRFRPIDAGVLLAQVRRVRAALEDGVVDDPDLVADLLPGANRRDPFQDTDDQMPRVIIDPSEDTGAWSPVQEFAADVPPANPQRGAAVAGFDDPTAYAPYSARSEDVYDQRSEHTTNLAQGRAAAAAVPVEEYDDEYDDGYDEPPPPRSSRERRPRRRRRPAILLALALVTALVIGLGAWYFGVARYTTTPGVINLKQSDAKSRIEKAGLEFNVDKTVYSEGVAAGAVLSTDPRPGSRILKSGTVDAVISRGPERHAVPDVRGKDLDQAQAAIQAAKLSFGKSVGKYDERVPKGQVIATTPAIGSELRRQTAVDVVISKGRKPIQVPDYTGKSGDDAIKAIQGLGLRTSTTQAYSDSVDKGDVVSQAPRGGTLFRGGKVALVISRGPQLVAVPKTAGMDVAAAKKLLRSKGFHTGTKMAPNYIGLGYVLGSDPKPGTLAPKGSKVIITIV